MNADWLYATSEWILFFGSILILLCFVQAGYRIGYRVHKDEKQNALSLISGLQAATLGLLALLIGFTFSMAVTRFEQRKELVLEEANAIGTTDLRTSLLPEPYASRSHNLLRSYLDARLSFQRNSEDEDKFNRANRESSRLQEDLWRQAVAVSAQQPLSIPTSLFVRSLNEMIDLHEKNLTALRNHVPSMSILLLYVVAFVGLGLMGYDCGLREVRHRLPNVIISVLIASVLIVIVDLDRPRHGFIQVGVEPLTDLLTSMPPAR